MSIMTSENLDMDYSKYDFKDSTEMYVYTAKRACLEKWSKRLAE